MLDALLSRRILFVAGKGGTGKTTISAALALVAARRGLRVLCVEVDPRGELSFALGAEPVGFEPREVQRNIHVLALQPEESLAEYLRIYFRVPRMARMTPLARVMDFVATGVPGAKDMLVVGKIAFEERRRERDRPVWDLIVVDTEATGHVLPQLGAARAMTGLMRGGIIMNQVRWIDEILADPERTLLVVTALPEEMPLTEAIELHDRARERTPVGIGACVLNRTFPLTPTPRQISVLQHAVQAGEPARDALGGDPAPLLCGALLAARLGEATQRGERRLRSAMSCPVLSVPLQSGSREGLATTRLVATALEAAR